MMQSAATIRDASRCLEEAAVVFRQRSRTALDEYAELGAAWSDSRARRFMLQHIEPQREGIDQGALLCRMHGELADTALSSAEEAERNLSAFFAAQMAFESAAGSSRHAVTVARDQATRALADTARISAEVQSIAQAIAAAATDIVG